MVGALFFVRAHAEGIATAPVLQGELCEGKERSDVYARKRVGWPPSFVQFNVDHVFVFCGGGFAYRH